MQLIIILLIAVSVLTMLSGIAVLSGSRKGERGQAFLFFFTTIASLLWAVPIGIFLGLPEDADPALASGVVHSYYVGAVVMCWGLMSYTCHKYLLGKIGMAIFGVIGAAIAGLIIYDPSLLYSSIELSHSAGNIVHLNQNIFYLIFGIYFCVTVVLYMIGLLYAAFHTKNPSFKKANIMVFIGFSITGLIALAFNLILPILGQYNTIWVGPLAMSIAWVFHYYAILRYHLINLSGRWLKTLSHVIIMSLAAIIYLSIFFIIFMALFKVASPSLEVILLTSIIVIIVLLLFPVLSEVSEYVRSLSSVEDIDIVYIVKKLNQLSKEYINYYELAGFLADHLHFKYVGLLIDKKVYGSIDLKITATEAEKINKFHGVGKGIWLEIPETEKAALKKRGIEAIAILRDSNGETVGKILLGRPMGNVTFSSRHLLPIETALTMIASTLNAEKGPKS